MNYYKSLQSGGKSCASKIKLILTAERVFSRYGIEGVSLREVASAAGSANNYAVQYHFQNKQGLLNAIYAYRIGELENRRRAMLEQAEAAGALDPRTLLRILCMPQLDLVGDDGINHYAGFMAQFASHYWHDDAEFTWGNPYEEAPCLERVVSKLLDRLALGSDELAMSRLVLCNEMFLHALVRWDNVERNGAPYSFATMIMRTLEAVEAAYLAPAGTGQDERELLDSFPSLDRSAGHIGVTEVLAP